MNDLDDNQLDKVLQSSNPLRTGLSDFSNNNCNSNNSNYDPGYDGIFELPEGMEKSSNESICYLAGSQSFKVLELEVYTL